jgi:hypothetical protein
LQAEFDEIMGLIEPRTNLPVVFTVGGRCDFTTDGSYWGVDQWT